MPENPEREYTANYTILLGNKIIKEREIILAETGENAMSKAIKRKESLSKEHAGAEVTLDSLIGVS